MTPPREEHYGLALLGSPAPRKLTQRCDSCSLHTITPNIVAQLMFIRQQMNMYYILHKLAKTLKIKILTYSQDDAIMELNLHYPTHIWGVLC
jgi:hypothetical protein